MVTGTVDDPEPPPPPSPPVLPPAPLSPLLEDCATGLTAVTWPPTVLPSGISTVTCSPMAASDWELALRSTVTTSFVEEVVITSVAPAPPPPLLPLPVLLLGVWLPVLPVGLLLLGVWLPLPLPGEAE